MSISQFHGIRLSRIDLRELNLSLRGNTDQLYAPPQSKLLNARGKPIVDYDSIGVKCGTDDTCVEFAPAFLHGSDQVYHRQSLVVLEFFKHLADGQIFLIDVVDFDEFGQFATRK